ncbi:LysR substrate-binding domain-containing protein [Pseudomonas fluorescens]|uniref:LysR substrate-binding domain-containing protein n=1 Tax=Pseudomonas fluorescens TaxID=294 RepID=UPI00125BD83C|nr:LysR substrate-binding domain-containing protein [Pseudomonas fluorescens]VVN69746.1 Octopine catabolism/uptake operon regulatory protein OccR [Pseudomonas fluorescens]
MNLRQLEAFRAVILGQTVTRAAEMLHISQPAATRLIGALEENIGFALFERIKGRLRPTPEALVLYEEVERSLLGVERIARTAREISDLKRGALQIACPPALGLSFLPRAIAEFLDLHEHAQITLIVQSSREVVDAIVGERCDVGFIAQPNAYPSPRGEKIIQSSLLCALPFNHRLRDQTVIGPRDLEGERFISYPHAVASRQHIDSIFAAYGVERRINLEIQLSMPMCQFVELGAGVALVDPISAHEYKGTDVIFRPFEPTIEMDFSMLVPQQKKTSKFQEMFLQHIRTFVAREIR